MYCVVMCATQCDDKLGYLQSYGLHGHEYVAGLVALHTLLAHGGLGVAGTLQSLIGVFVLALSWGLTTVDGNYMGSVVLGSDLAVLGSDKMASGAWLITSGINVVFPHQISILSQRTTAPYWGFK